MRLTFDKLGTSRPSRLGEGRGPLYLGAVYILEGKIKDIIVLLCASTLEHVMRIFIYSSFEAKYIRPPHESGVVYDNIFFSILLLHNL